MQKSKIEGATASNEYLTCCVEATNDEISGIANIKTAVKITPNIEKSRFA